MEEVRGDSVRVRIVQTSACAACKVAGHCSAAESKEKVVEVVDCRAAAYAPGDSVVVSIEPSTGRRAVILAFVVPFLILVAVLVIALWAIGDEGRLGKPRAILPPAAWHGASPGKEVLICHQSVTNIN